MKDTRISFVSSKNRGLTLDLKLLQDYLSQNIENVNFCYFTVNENSNNSMAKKGAKAAKKAFCKSLENAVCVDGSLPAKLEETAEQGDKILILIPYDYLFKMANISLKNQNVKKKSTFNGFTHIMAGSPFVKEMIEKCYKTPKAQIIDHICTPLMWDVNCEDRQKTVRLEFQKYFPAIEGKKILSILITKRAESEEVNTFEQFDWEKLIKSLGENWFIFTNHESLMENTVRLDFDYTAHFGYVNQILDARRLLYFSDCLITNSSMYATTFSSTKKPVYGISYNNNEFEKFMKNQYPELFVQDLTKIMELQIERENNTKENQRFCEYFSYDVSQNPFEKIKDILLENK